MISFTAEIEMFTFEPKTNAYCVVESFDGVSP